MKKEECSFFLLAPSSHLTVASSTPTATSRDMQPAPSIGELYTVSNKRHNAVAACRRDSSCPDRQNRALWDRSHSNYCEPYPNTSSTSQPPKILVPPYLRFQDAWKDTRSALPSALQDLLHHYDHATSLTIENGDQATAVWQSGIPEIATDHDFLVHCVLSISSLHLGHLFEATAQPKQMSYWNAVAASQMNHALSGYCTEIERITGQNVAAVFASSALTAVYLFRTSIMDFKYLQAGIPSRRIHAPEVAARMMSCVVRAMWGLRGPLEVLMKGWSWLVNGKMLPVTSRKWWPKTREPASPCARDEDERLRRIEDLWRQTDRQYDPHSNHLSQALDLLRETYALVSQLVLFETSKASHGFDTLVDRGAMFSWVTRVPREYIQLVEAQDRDALVILAHYAVLLTRTSPVWWLEGLGSNFVTAIAMALGSGYWELIEWPMRIASVDLTFIAS